MDSITKRNWCVELIVKPVVQLKGKENRSKRDKSDKRVY